MFYIYDISACSKSSICKNNKEKLPWCCVTGEIMTFIDLKERYFEVNWCFATNCITKNYINFQLLLVIIG